MARNQRIDAYLATLPQAQHELLEGLRALIERVAPAAVETISYDMPAFKLDGRFLVAYAGWKKHCSIYPLTDSFLYAHEAALAAFGRTKGSLHFTPATPVPDELMEALIRARIVDLEAEARTPA